MNIRVSKNKTEELMYDITDRSKRSKKKYFVVCEYRGVQYVDGSKDIQFLKSVYEKLGQILLNDIVNKGKNEN